MSAKPIGLSKRLDQKSIVDLSNTAIPESWTRRFPAYLKFVVESPDEPGRIIELEPHSMQAENGEEVTIYLKTKI